MKGLSNLVLNPQSRHLTTTSETTETWQAALPAHAESGPASEAAPAEALFNRGWQCVRSILSLCLRELGRGQGLHGLRMSEIQKRAASTSWAGSSTYVAWHVVAFFSSRTSCEVQRLKRSLGRVVKFHVVWVYRVQGVIQVAPTHTTQQLGFWRRPRWSDGVHDCWVGS